jgi:S1-C subfamily serine protease
MSRSRVARATVTIFKDEESGPIGQGFLVHGGYILTAAHCVPWSGEGQMPLGEYFLVTVIAADGRRLTGQVVAVEPVSDIAVIGSPDGQTFSSQATDFDNYLESTEGLILCKDDFPFGAGFPVQIYTHTAEWISGEATQWGENVPTLSFETKPPVVAGTSGSAIVNDRGEVVGVVSSASETAEEAGDSDVYDGTCARPCQSLPVWLWRAIKSAEKGDNQDVLS